MEHDETFEDTWEARENEWLLMFKTTYYQLLGLDEITNFGKKNTLTLPRSAIKCFNSLGDDNDELK